MMEILEKLVSKKEANAVYKLLQDDNKLIILQSFGKRFLNSEDVFTNDPVGQFILLIANAPFLKSDEECMQIANMVQWGITKSDVFPMITEHKNEELAYRCLLSLGFYKDAMERKTRYHGAPSPSFYRTIGISTFKNIGFEEVSMDFNKWECYLGEMTC